MARSRSTFLDDARAIWRPSLNVKERFAVPPQVWNSQRLSQPVVHGLSTHGQRTQLYTSRGTGFWGPLPGFRPQRDYRPYASSGVKLCPGTATAHATLRPESFCRST